MRRSRSKEITTIRALISVDAQGNSSAAITLFRRLDFADCETTILHSVESILPDGSYPGAESTSVISDMLDEMERAGSLAMEQAAAELGDCVVDRKILHGDPLRNLLDLGKSDACALIVVGTQNRSSFEKAVMGSVSRGLLTKAEHSFLVGKPYGTGTGPVTAIFATDHSEYCDRCADLLMELRPQGVGNLIVLSVMDAETVPPQIQADTDALVHRFKSLFPSVHGVIAPGEVEPTMHDQMLSTGAELMIVGAQGHGFLDRLFGSGSTSYYEVEQEPWSTLVLRP